MSSVSRTLSRRTVLQLLSALTAGAAACNSGGGGGKAGGTTGADSGGGTTGTGDTGSAPAADLLVSYEEVLVELQTYARAAADHRLGEADRLVEAADPEGILAFVRDQIVWHPGPGVNPYNGAFVPEINREGGGRKYGPRGALRAGGGSALDRALLLQGMLSDAGFTDARLAWFDGAALAGDDPAHLFVREWVRPEPELPVPDDVWQRWGAALGLDLDSLDLETVPDPDVDGAPEALATELLGLFDDPDVPDRSDECRWESVRGPVPAVRFTLAPGDERIANPALPEATLDAPGVDASTEVDADDVPDDPGPLPVDVKLSIRTTRSAEWRDEVVLVEGRFTADQLMGRQLLVATLPVTDTLGIAAVPAPLHHVFQTALMVQALDSGDDLPEPVVGEAVSLGGERLSVDDAGVVSVDGVAVTSGDDGPRADPADVASIRLEVDGSHFPAIFARAWPTDASGGIVENLQADQLLLEDEGRPTPVLLQANRAVPRVILLRDESLSMPADLRGAAGEAVMDAVATAIETTWPGATITIEATGSDLWTRLAQAASEGANAVVYLTDGDVNDDSTTAIEAALQAGPPAILIAVGDASGVPPDSLVQMADLTGGVVVPVEDPAAVEAAVVDTLGTVDLPPYQLRWTAAAGETGERLAVLQIGSEAGDTLYEARADNEPVRLMALDLELTLDGRTLRRTLAGWPASEDYPTDRALRDALHTEVHLALLGGRMLSFEGDGPSPSMLLDDLITVRRASLPFLQTDGLDLDALLAQVEQGCPSLPGPMIAAWQPLQETYDAESLTFPGTLRVAMTQVRPEQDGQEWSTLDLLDVSRWRTVTRSGDARANFELNLVRTARLAVLEQLLGDESTLSLLDGQPLAEIGDRGYRDTTEPAVWRRWNALLSQYRGIRIGPEDGTTIAFFYVNEDSGALVAVMPDGSGGARQIMAILDALDAIIHLHCFATGAGPGLGLASAYAITLARLYAAVSVALDGFVTAGLDDEVRCALENFACEALVRISAPPLLKAINRGCGMALGFNLCSLVASTSDC